MQKTTTIRKECQPQAVACKNEADGNKYTDDGNGCTKDVGNKYKFDLALGCQCGADLAATCPQPQDTEGGKGGYQCAKKKNG